MRTFLLALCAAASVALAGEPAAQAAAKVGAPAPDFSLTDLEGKTVKLSELKGKRVVLEWFNPGCPYVKAAHDRGALVDAAKRAQKGGAVWLAVNSGAAGKQGASREDNVAAKHAWALEHPILLDPDGRVGKAYGATNTPHMFVIDEKGTLVFAGGVDNSPDGEGQSAPDGKWVRHVDAALADLAAGRPVKLSTAKAYGCSVKYASK